MKTINPMTLVIGAAAIVGGYLVLKVAGKVLPSATASTTGAPAYNPDNVVSNVSEYITGINLTSTGRNLGSWLYRVTH